MAAKIHGRLAAIGLAGFTYGAGTGKLIYAAPAGRKATVSLSLCNASGGSLTTQRIFIGTSVTAGAGEYLEYGPTIASGGVLERTGITLAAGQGIYADQTSTATGPSASFVVWGIEEDI